MSDTKENTFLEDVCLKQAIKKVGKETTRVMIEFVRFPVMVQNSTSELQQTGFFFRSLCELLDRSEESNWLLKSSTDLLIPVAFSSVLPMKNCLW